MSLAENVSKAVLRYIESAEKWSRSVSESVEHTMDSLDRIESRLSRLEEQVEHLVDKEREEMT